MGRALRTGNLGEVLEPPTMGATLGDRRAVGLSPACTQELPTVALQKECAMGATCNVSSFASIVVFLPLPTCLHSDVYDKRVGR